MNNLIEHRILIDLLIFKDKSKSLHYFDFIILLMCILSFRKMRNIGETGAH